MKILHLSKYHFPEKGGVENVVNNLVKVSFEGMINDVLCFDKNSNKIEKQTFSTIYHSKSFFNLFSQPISITYLYRIWRLVNNYDILHVHLPNPFAVLGLYLCPKIKPKIIIHWHSDIVEQKFIYFFIQKIQKNILKKSSKIIFTSKNYLAATNQIFDFHNKCQIIPIGIPDIDEIKAPTIDQQYQKEIQVTSIGRLVTYKGFDKLILAAKLIDNNVKISIVGNGPLYSELRKLVNSNNLENKVDFLGKLSDLELIKVLKSTDIFCLPSISRNEAFGVVLLEAMSNSLPIVCYDIEGSGVPWVVQNHFNGLVVENGNIEELASAINQLASSSDLRKTYGNNSRERFLKYFKVNKMLQEFHDLYQNVLER